MAYIREFTSFRSNIVRLKNYVNKNYQSDKDNELYLIMFIQQLTIIQTKTGHL